LEIKAEYRDWLRRKEWQWSAHLTFRTRQSFESATKSFNSWFTQLRSSCQSARFVRVIERGDEGGRLHIHALIGGVKGIHRRIWATEWGRMAGHASIEHLDQKRLVNAIGYMFKSVRESADNVDFNLEDERVGNGTATTNDGQGGSGILEGQPSAGVQDDFRAEDNGSKDQPQVRAVSTASLRAMGAATRAACEQISSAIQTTPSAAMLVRSTDDWLIMALRIEEPKASRSGKTQVFASTKGPRVTLANLDGKPIMVVASAMVSPSKPSWKLRLHADLARMEGTLG
jgi:hypothetical protein